MSDGLSLFERMKTTYAKSMLGFWLYIMTDTVLFGSVFATYVVLRNNTAGGLAGSDIFSLPFVLVETVLLLTSSFTVGLALIALQQKDRYQTLWWLAITAGLGGTFLGMEITEFTNMVTDGHGWWVSGFLSGYFTLVGLHGLHILAGLIWVIVLSAQLLHAGINKSSEKRLLLFSLFWHFLDVIWIGIFTVVYLMGVI